MQSQAVKMLQQSQAISSGPSQAAKMGKNLIHLKLKLALDVAEGGAMQQQILNPTWMFPYYCS